MKPFLMGAETEYAVSGRNGAAHLSARDVYSLLFKALQSECHWLSDVNGGEAVYLENGGRLYLDYGQHPEYATPECLTPEQVTAYDKAGERLLDLARRRVQAEHPAIALTLLKNNLNPQFPDECTWGTHESYTCWVDAGVAARAMLPHLASRTIYAGSGCLSAFAGGTGFELSQRARHVVHTVGGDTTSERALFCTRIRKCSDLSAAEGWTRAHLISKDSQRAPLGIYLTHGTTALLFLLLNEGRRVGVGLELENPIVALRAISCDPWLRKRVRLADGRSLTALEIQQLYHEDCAREVQRGDLPPWAGAVVRHWGETLAELAKDPLRMARKLDPYYKLFVFDHELKRAGRNWSELREALESLSVLRADYPASVIRALLAEEPNSLDAEEQSQYGDAWAAAGLGRPGTLEKLRLAVRLQHFDLHYHEVGGLYDQLADSGHLPRVVVGTEDVEKATREAPPGGRAALRGELVRTLRDEGWVCEWRYLYHARTGEFVDLRNPFAGQFRPGYWPRVYSDNAMDPDVQEIAAQLSRRGA